MLQGGGNWEGGWGLKILAKTECIHLSIRRPGLGQDCCWQSWQKHIRSPVSHTVPSLHPQPVRFLHPKPLQKYSSYYEVLISSTLSWTCISKLCHRFRSRCQCYRKQLDPPPLLFSFPIYESACFLSIIEPASLINHTVRRPYCHPSTPDCSRHIQRPHLQRL